MFIRKPDRAHSGCHQAVTAIECHQAVTAMYLTRPLQPNKLLAALIFVGMLGQAAPCHVSRHQAVTAKHMCVGTFLLNLISCSHFGLRQFPGQERFC